MLQIIALLIINHTLSTVAATNPELQEHKRILLTIWNLILGIVVLLYWGQ
jgi:cadmium resistance protein CadD (predicted permease)